MAQFARQRYPKNAEQIKTCCQLLDQKKESDCHTQASINTRFPGIPSSITSNRYTTLKRRGDLLHQEQASVNLAGFSCTISKRPTRDRKNKKKNNT